MYKVIDLRRLLLAMCNYNLNKLVGYKRYCNRNLQIIQKYCQFISYMDCDHHQESIEEEYPKLFIEGLIKHNYFEEQ